jgi:hypothetical protein
LLPRPFGESESNQETVGACTPRTAGRRISYRAAEIISVLNGGAATVRIPAKKQSDIRLKKCTIFWSV